MITVVQRDLGVTYEPDCINVREFRNSREGFIHGLLAGDKRGTCANMPVLYAAVGRALGYPIYLVAAKGHYFCRWHSVRTGERFNIEGSGRGLNVFLDDHYMRWPRPITDQEVYHGIYLRNLEPVEELAFFMATRGHCLCDKGHVLDAIVAYSHAHRLAPTDPMCMSFLLGALNQEIVMRQDGTLPCTYRQAEIFNRLDLIRAMSWVESKHGTAGANQAGRDPMQSGNPKDQWWQGLQGQGAQDRVVGGPGKGNWDLGQLPGATGIPAPPNGHNDPSFTPDMSYLWGALALIHKMNTGPNGGGRTYRCGDCSWDQLIAAATAYNGGGDPNYEQKIRDALKMIGSGPK